MRNSLLLTLALLAGIATSHAQTPVVAPAGWKTQTKANGAKTFTPSDLRAGEVFSVTLYDSAPMEGKSLQEYLRESAGTTGTKPGQLSAPLQIEAQSAQAVSGVGSYFGPKGVRLVAVFNAFSFDGGQNVWVSRALSSSDAMLVRHQSEYVSLVKAMVERARNQTIQEAPPNLVDVPAPVLKHLKPGGALVPGIYAGDQFLDEKLDSRLRLYIYPSGEYRFKNERDENFREGYNAPISTGTVGYQSGTGQLNLSISFNMISSTGSLADDDFCFYGRNGAGKPAIYAEYDLGFHTSRTLLVWVAPLDKNSSPSVIKAREAAKKAEEERYKFVVAPGKGVANSQISALLHFADYSNAMVGTVTETVYLLLKDGTVHEGLPVPPDQLNVPASRRGEPKTWGRWRKTAKGYQVSWAGKPFEELKGEPVLPGAAQARLEGRYATVRASMYWHQFWGVTFGKTGRFSKDRRGGVTTGNIPMEGGLGLPRVDSTYDDGGSGTSVIGGGVGGASVTKRNPNGAREGTYSINGYTLTLRYDNGQVVRLPFFLTSDRKHVWFEDNTLQLGLED